MPPRAAHHLYHEMLLSSSPIAEQEEDNDFKDEGNENVVSGEPLLLSDSQFTLSSANLPPQTPFYGIDNRLNTL